MKKIILLLIVWGNIAAQTVYEVKPGTTGNEIILTIVNESVTENTGKVTVTLPDAPSSLEIKNCGVQIDDIKKGEEGEVRFLFNVKRIPEAVKDTLHFKVTLQNGESRQKEIILSYSLPEEFKLEQNYPNPFNPATTIELSIPASGAYKLTVYNLLGQEVKTLIDGNLEAGYHKTAFNGGEFASGIYIYRLTGNNVNLTKKMLLMK